MEAVLKSLDQRVGRIEQILPTLATKNEMAMLRTEMTSGFASVRAEIGSLDQKVQSLDQEVRSVGDDVRLVAETVANLIVRLERKGVI